MEEVILRQRKWVSCMTMTSSSSFSPFLPPVCCGLYQPAQDACRSRSLSRDYEESLDWLGKWRGEHNRKMALWVGSMCRTSFRGICIARCRAEWDSKRWSSPYTGLSRPLESGKLRLLIFSTFDTTKVVRSSPLRTGRLYPQEFSCYSFLKTESTPGHMVPSVASQKTPSDTTGNRSRDPPTSSAVP
jgi:hypothetical protein